MDAAAPSGIAAPSGVPPPQVMMIQTNDAHAYGAAAAAGAGAAGGGGGGGGGTHSGASWLFMMNEMRLVHQQVSRAEAAGTKFWIDVQQERHNANALSQQAQASNLVVVSVVGGGLDESPVTKLWNNSSFALGPRVWWQLSAKTSSYPELGHGHIHTHTLKYGKPSFSWHDGHVPRSQNISLPYLNMDV